VTGLRPNCFIELGYALARTIPAIVTAAIGTVLPFDQNAIPCHFWDPETGKDLSIRKLLEFIAQNLERPPLIFWSRSTFPLVFAGHCAASAPVDVVALIISYD
jgi:hypothetical protein